MKQIRFAFGLVGCLAVFTSSAQDVHFSQFFNAPLTVSPSNTGNYVGDWRVMGNYRTQWSQIGQAYLTQSLGFDKQFFIKNENFSAGIFLINDASAVTLKVQKIQLSAAYHKTINKHNIHAGIQIGYTNEEINPNTETYPDQFNWSKGAFDPSLPNSENNVHDRLGYFDLNAGVGYSLKLKKITPFINVAFFHLNYPQESFFNNANRLKPRTAINAGVDYSINAKWAIDPAFWMMTTDKASDAMIGTNLYYKLAANKANATSLSIGGFYRSNVNIHTDAAVAAGGIQFKNYRIGASYDFNLSALHSATNYRGAFELALIYIAPNTRLRKIEIPCDRY
jgi:type IX secretion system PorP/SprF family membrane protein